MRRSNVIGLPIKLILTVILTCLISTAYAGPVTLTGKWAGTAFASGAIDLNGDGNGARIFDVRTYDQFFFLALQGAVDSSIVALPGQPGNSCDDPAALELEPRGKITFRGWKNDAVFTEIDSSAHLCFNPASPDETLLFTIIGGTGFYQGVSGSGQARLFDTVLEATPEGFPLVVDTQGSFSITFD